MSNVPLGFAAVLILLSGCASTTPEAVFLPVRSSETVPFFRNGIPIGALKSDSSIVMISLEPTEIAHHKYMRLWLLYMNNSNTPFLLEPLKALVLHLERKDNSFEDILPDSPTQILAHIKNEEATSMIFQAIGGTLEALSAQPTTIKSSKGEEWKVNDKSAKVEAITNKTAASMANTALLYDIFKGSVNAGVLRRNTIFSLESVNGYVYFSIPTIEGHFADKISLDPSKYNFKLTINTQFGEKTVDFEPAEGE